MSVGNLKSEGNKGNNFPWQLKMLLGQQCACDQLELANSILQDIDNNTDQVEPLLVQILSAIQNGSDFEAFLVVDDNDVTWLEVRIWNPSTGTFDPPVYFVAGSNTTGTPAAPISYVNPNSYLAQIVSNTTGLATETTLAAVDTKLTSAVRTPNISTIVNASGSTPAGVYSFSIANVGSAAGTVDGQALPAGITINFDAGALNNTLSSLPYDASGTTFIITYIS